MIQLTGKNGRTVYVSATHVTCITFSDGYTNVYTADSGRELAVKETPEAVARMVEEGRRTK